MQIIAIGMFLLFCAVVVILSGAVGFIFACLTAVSIKGVTGKRCVTIAVTNALPFFCLALVLTPLVLVVAGLRSGSFPGSCALPNGYSLMMTAASEPGWVYSPRNEATPKSVAWQKDGVDGVELLQVAGRYIVGGRNSRGWRPSTSVVEVDSYFLLDTETANLTTLSTFQQLQGTAEQLGIQLNLERVYIVYGTYGMMHWGKLPMFGIYLLSPVLLWFVLRWAMRIRALRSSSQRRWLGEDWLLVSQLP
ncbi:MAG TPA: hypothetical protein VLL05_19460 [Terriglobales bacterium]|nr:hypothetical protein [Terriglobales bacterium]